MSDKWHFAPLVFCLADRYVLLLQRPMLWPFWCSYVVLPHGA